ncbi:hypothetical protein [Salisediminibacterium halotolerans]|uniref:hypothetical protein n=1 Tax=Salisediminibacterium halotolerans TaxID=517425 RepID=UPI0013155B90|nr:hypothetical protein [Salisediminibacterium halotolerans]
MISIDVLLKGTADCASSGFFHLKVSLRHRLKRLRRLLLVRGRAPSRFELMPCRVSPVSLFRRRMPGCRVILFFESSVFIIKKATHPLLRRLWESKRRRSGFGDPRPPNTS